MDGLHMNQNGYDHVDCYPETENTGKHPYKITISSYSLPICLHTREVYFCLYTFFIELIY